MTILYDDAVSAEFGTINVKTYGAKGDGVNDDAGAIQDAINAAKTLGAALTFSPGRYLVGSNLILPSGIGSTAGYNRWFRIYGNNASLITTTSGVTILDRHVTALTDSHRGDFWNPIITDLHLSGVPGANAIRIDRSASVLLQNLWLYNFDKGIELVFALYPRLQSINTQYVERAFRVLGGYGIFSDGGIDNSSSNAAVLAECRAQTFTPTSVPFKISQSQMVRLENCVAEGSWADIACQIDSKLGGTSLYDNIVTDGFWCEYTSGINKVFEISSNNVHVNINNLVLPDTSPSPLIVDANNSSNSVFNLTNISSWERLNPLNPWFFDSVSGYNRWIFTNAIDDSTRHFDFMDRAHWTSGLTPFYVGPDNQDAGWVNLDLGHATKGWHSSGATPPTVGSGVFFGKNEVRLVTFTSGNSIGFSNSRAKYVNENLSISPAIYRTKANIQLSRALSGSEAINIYYTGNYASDFIKLNATTTSGIFNEWTTYYSKPKHVFTSTNLYLTCYLLAAVGTSVDIYIADPELQKIGTQTIVSSSVKSLAMGGDWFTLPVNTVVPSVSGYSYCKTANTSGTIYTNFSGGYSGQHLYLKLDTNSTIQHGSSVRLNGAANFQPSGAGGTLTLLNDTGVWFEISRAVF